MHPYRVVLLLAVGLSLGACVPSPTATPPRTSPFPTLPLQPTDTPLPTVTLTPVPAVATAVPTSQPSATPSLTRTPSLVASSTAVPVPSGTSSARPAASIETLPPLLQVLPSDASSPVSSGQTVAFGVLAADDTGLARVELYDEGKFYTSTVTLNPAPRLLTTVLNWKPQRTGPHHLRFVAYDSSGNASAPVGLTYDVLTDNKRPIAQFTNFVGATDLAVGAPILLQGVATDEVAITRVDLYVDDVFYTFITPGNRDGLTPFAFNLMWVPTTAGTHKLYLRAHDSENQTGDSPPLQVNALNAQVPAVQARYERDQVPVNGTLVTYVLALSPNGVTRVELWADDQPADAAASSLPDGQTAVSAPLVWQAGSTAGDHWLTVRAIDRLGVSTTTQAQLIHVLAAGTRLATATPIPPLSTETPAPRAPTATPQVLVPAPPTIMLTTEQDPTAVTLNGPLHLRLSAHGAAELSQVQVWANYQGETTPMLVFADSIAGATDKTLTVDWTPPRAGIVAVYAQVTDQLGQAANSAPLSVYLVWPAMPAPTPALPSLVSRWSASIPTDRFDLMFQQIGRALRGSFTDTPLNTSPAIGTIVAGGNVRDRLSFSVEFPGRAGSPHWLDFDCLIATTPDQLTCNYQDETGNRGSAIFTPER